MPKNIKYQIPGFQFSGIPAGIKKTRKPDLALIYSEVPATVVGCFTTNLVQAAPVLASKKNIRSGVCRAVVVNSGNANACTGARGLRDARAMVERTARLLKIPKGQVLVCSTGKIGEPLPMGKVLKGIDAAVRRLSKKNFLKSAEAILTTDAGIKTAYAEESIGGKKYRIAGFAKGAGMIEPHMATMLAYVCTDAFVPRSVLTPLFRDAVEKTFNRVTVDGDTSTNDTALILANGLAGNKAFAPKSPEARSFGRNLFEVMDSLARQMVRDGEGATKCVAVEIRGAKNDADARRMAYAVGNSALVKTSFFGQDPNWGRIMAAIGAAIGGAIGRAGSTLKPEAVDIYYDRVCVFRRGQATGEATDRAAKRVMKKPAFTVTVDAHLGHGSFRIYASDLTLDYVKINSCYRT